MRPPADKPIRLSGGRRLDDAGYDPDSDRRRLELEEAQARRRLAEIELERRQIEEREAREQADYRIGRLLG